MNRPLPDAAREQIRAFMIGTTAGECRRLFESNIFSPEGARSPLFQSAAVQMLICLNDLLQKAAREGARIAFADNVTIDHEVADVTDLVSKCRNAACHIGSPHAEFEFGTYRFNVTTGRGAALRIGDVEHGVNEFEDDVAVFYGHFRLYLRRHALRAFREVSVALGVDGVA